MTDRLSARRTTSPAVAVLPRVTEAISGGGVPTSPRALGHQGSGERGLGACSLVPGCDQIEQRTAVAEDADLAKPLSDARTGIHRDRVIDKTREGGPLGIDKNGLGGHGDLCPSLCEPRS